MKKKIVFILFPLVLIVGIFLIFKPESESIPTTSSELTNNNVNKGHIRGELVHLEFEEAITKADLIAKVKIGKVIEEFEEPVPKTLLDTTIVEILKGDSETNSIQVLQHGNSKWIVNDNELLQEGKQYLLFLKESETIEQPNTYWILGEESTTYEDLGNNLLKKIAYPDPSLSSVENVSMSKKFNTESDTDIEVQILDESLFYKLIQDEVNNN